MAARGGDCIFLVLVYLTFGQMGGHFQYVDEKSENIVQGNPDGPQ